MLLCARSFASARKQKERNIQQWNILFRYNCSLFSPGERLALVRGKQQMFVCANLAFCCHAWCGFFDFKQKSRLPCLQKGRISKANSGTIKKP